ncbi:MAG: Na/Pi cotransporter family protein [Pseudomonadota bacterium]
MTLYTPSLSMRFRIVVLSIALLLLLLALPVLGESVVEEAGINWFTLGMGLFGGLAMFLFGMEQMSEGLKAAAGNTLKDVLATLTRNRFTGAVTGAFVTAVLNSSSVTTVLVVGFISAGFMTLAQSVGVIMGANVGSTFTAQIVAFNITHYALLLVAAGFFMLFSGKEERVRHSGAMLMGLGLIFYGMGVMGEAMAPLRNYQPFLDLMVRMENPLLGILVGAVFTGLVQSSAATTGIAIVMASAGLISLPAGIALAFGANIGTCVTAILASLGKPVEAQRAAAVHVIFNIAGVLLWVMFIPQLAEFVVSISPAAQDLSGKARMAAEVPRQIANAHTVFNLANTILFLGFTTTFARLVERLIPEKPVFEKVLIKPRFLDKDVIDVPAMALEQVRSEIGHMGEIIIEMFSTLRAAVGSKNRSRCDSVVRMQHQVDILHDAILEYLSKVRQEPLTDQQSHCFQSLMSATVNLGNLATTIESDLVELGKRYIDLDEDVSEATGILLNNLTDTIRKSIDDAVTAVRERDEKAAEEVIAAKDDVRDLADEFLSRQSERIGKQQGTRLSLVRMEMELLDRLRGIYTLTKRIAKDFVPQEVGVNA